jgi:uncharacterized protein
MIPLRLVLDTNILVSAVLKPEGFQRAVFLISVTKPARLYISAAVLAEYREVLYRPELAIRRPMRRQFLDLLKVRAHMTWPVRQLQITADPDDNIFLECADAARADYLVTGNTRHFPRFWKQTKIINSREFLSITAPHILG